MEEIREVHEKIYSIRIYSDWLRGYTRLCPEDGAEARATGDMYLRTSSDKWSVEYYCPKEKETFKSWTPEIDGITKQIAERVLGKSRKDG